MKKQNDTFIKISIWVFFTTILSIIALLVLLILLETPNQTNGLKLKHRTMAKRIKTELETTNAQNTRSKIEQGKWIGAFKNDELTFKNPLESSEGFTVELNNGETVVIPRYLKLVSWLEMQNEYDKTNKYIRIMVIEPNGEDSNLKILFV